VETDYVDVEFLVRLPKELAKRLRDLAAQQNMYPRDLIEKIVADYLAKT
jgi:hypothetical protein